MSAFAIYQRELDELKAQLYTRKGQKKQLEDELERLAAEQEAQKRRLQALQKAHILLQEAAKMAREQGKARLEEVVTAALHYVFGPHLRFEVELTESAGRAQAEFYIVTEQDGETIRTRPMDANGGGVVDIVSLALRIALLELHQDPRLMGPIILDEPGKHVSDEYAEKMASFLRYVSQTFGRQVILVTHQPYLVGIADKAFIVQQVGGVSHVVESGDETGGA